MQPNTTPIQEVSPKDLRSPLTIREYDCLRATHHCRVLGRLPTEHQVRRIVNGQCVYDHVDEARAAALFEGLVERGYLERDRPHPSAAWRYALTDSGRTRCLDRRGHWGIMDEEPDGGNSE